MNVRLRLLQFLSECVRFFYFIFIIIIIVIIIIIIIIIVKHGLLKRVVGMYVFSRCLRQ